MKRVFAWVLLIVILFAGCTSQQPVVPMKNKSFLCTADFTYGGIQMSAELTRKAEGIYTVEVTAPDTIKGFRLDVSGDAVTAEFMGLRLDVTDRVPQANVILTMIKILDDLTSEKSLQAMLKDQKYIISGSSEGMAYQAEVSAENGALLSLEVTEINLKVQFRSFRYF